MIDRAACETDSFGLLVNEKNASCRRCSVDRNGSVGLAIRCGLDCPGFESWWGAIFRTRLDRAWKPPIFQYYGLRVCSPPLP
jgi:hypothetical protein